MAIQATGSFAGLPFTGGYVRIDRVTGGKQTGWHCVARLYASEAAAKANPSQFVFEWAVNPSPAYQSGMDPVALAYGAIKTAAEREAAAQLAYEQALADADATYLAAVAAYDAAMVEYKAAVAAAETPEDAAAILEPVPPIKQAIYKEQYGIASTPMQLGEMIDV